MCNFTPMLLCFKDDWCAVIILSRVIVLVPNHIWRSKFSRGMFCWIAESVVAMSVLWNTPVIPKTVRLLGRWAVGHWTFIRAVATPVPAVYPIPSHPTISFLTKPNYMHQNIHCKSLQAHVDITTWTSPLSFFWCHSVILNF